MARSDLSSRADGVVRSTTDYRMLTQPPRPLPCLVASRHFYYWSRPHLLCQGGEKALTPPFVNSFSAIVFIIGTIFLLGLGAQTIATQNNPPAAGPAKLLIPHDSWNCGMPDGIPNPEAGTP